MGNQTKTKEDWDFDDECPECGENVHIGAIVQETDEDGEPVKAEMVCGTKPESPRKDTWDIGGCGHTWDWERFD